MIAPRFRPPRPPAGRLRCRRRARPALVVGALLLLPAAAAPAAEPTAPAARQPVLTTPWFRFFSDFEFDLYDAVLTAATERRQERPDPLHGDCFAALVQEERSAWDAAVAYYADTVAATSDFSRERFIVRTRLAGFAPALDDDDRRDLALSLLFLDAAAPAYRACAWPDQDAVNRRWIAELAPRLARHADAIGHRLEELFGVRWRSLPIDVDVVGTAGWSGADTIAVGALPTHTQITSRDAAYQGANALEMIFHEASHELVSPRNGPIAELLASTAKAAGVGVDRNLWHGLLFVTVGEVTRSALAATGEGPYTPVAEGVFRGAWQPLHEPLVTCWLPYVRGESDRESAARQLLLALATPP